MRIPKRTADAADLDAVEVRQSDVHGRGVFALRNLRAGDELFLDYALVIDGDDPADYPCACGTDACRGTMAALAAISASAL